MDGDRSQFIAIGAQRWDHETLRDRPNKLLARLHRSISQQWSTAADDERSRLRALSGYLDGVEGFLFQCSRMRQHADGMVASATASFSKLPPGSHSPSMALSAITALTDFESLLFHGRALLDRLTALWTRPFGGGTDRFTKLSNVLSANAKADPQAHAMLRLLADAGDVAGLLTDPPEGRGSLRSLVVHKTASGQGVSNVFTLMGVGQRRVLLIDCRTYGHGVITSSHALNQRVAHIVLGGIALLLDEKPLSLKAFTPAWENPAVLLDEYVRDSGPLLTVVAVMNPDGMELRREHVDRRILERALRA